MDNANACGLKVIVCCYVPLDSLKTLITSIRDHPALIAWMVYDEPASADPMAQQAYNLSKQLDPWHPAYVNYGCFYVPATLLSDIASYDNYPIPQLPPLEIAKDADKLESIALPAGKPAWEWLQSTGYIFYWSREPTGPEEECMVYLALIHGVRGVQFFANKPLTDELWLEMRQLALEVRTLTPILYSLETAPKVTSAPESIHLAVKRRKGEVYLIAVNHLPTPVNCVLSLPGNFGNRASVLFENRTLGVRNGEIHDRFEGYQRHVYRIR